MLDLKVCLLNTSVYLCFAFAVLVSVKIVYHSTQAAKSNLGRTTSAASLTATICLLVAIVGLLA